ncbi:sugar phosphate isomerase/epimerase [Candidatus Peregrinibacteria bacterium]|nr:sugar phosphate isomerase/epimerase [Candidatus Peregrinibacteria bacterium]
MNIRLGGHWLAFLWTLVAGQGHLLTDAVAKAKSAGASVFELIFHALNQMSATETASALKAGGMSRAIMCIFFPPGKDNAPPPLGDPLSDEESPFQQAVTNFRQTFGFILELRTLGIEIDLIVGPSCWVLGKDYELSQDELNRRILRFYQTLEPDLKAAGVRVAIELLRAGEDRVVQNIDTTIQIVDMLNSKISGDLFGVHYDSFHFEERRFEQGVCIRRLGKRIFHLHLNGSGRRPAGGQDDTIDWSGQNGVIPALKEVGVDGLTATNEPFCALVRANSPELGTGLPDPVDEPGGINTTRQTLEKNGVTIIQ